MLSRGARRLPLLLVLLLLLASGCAGRAKLVSEKAYAPPGEALVRLAVVPFYAHRTYEGTRRLGGVPADEATGEVTRLLAAALAARGIEVVPPAEVAAAVADVPQLTTAVDALVYSEALARELSATGVLLGEVLRYRNPRGASAVARRPASVAFQLTLYQAPAGFKLWSARFDETQSAPEGGDGTVPPPSHWLSAEDLARRGAESVARTLAGYR